MTILVSPSILAADQSMLGEEIRRIDAAGADMIHVDVMDGHFVPNLTIGSGVIRDLRKATKKPFDVHLMMSPVDSFIPDFVAAGADYLTIHPEAGPHLHRSLQLIRDEGAKPGLALNPATPLSVVGPVLEDIDLILVMSVNPGFGGQKFIASQLARIAELRRMIEASGREVILEVDGGVNRQTVGDVIAAGASAVVAGSAVFTGDPDAYAGNIAALRESA